MRKISSTELKDNHLTFISQTCTSDYIGDITTYCNFVTIKNKFKDNPHFFEVYGDWSFKAIAHDNTPEGLALSDEIQEKIEKQGIYDDSTYGDTYEKVVMDYVNSELPSFILGYTEEEEAGAVAVDVILNNIDDPKWVKVEEGCSVFIDWDRVQNELRSQGYGWEE